jgi:predicted dienelactone hydrolase
VRCSLFALCILAACSDDGGAPDAGTPDGRTPDAFTLAAPADRAALFQQGPYTVGYRTQSVTYRPAGVATDRTLNVELWYPAQASTGVDTVYSVGGALAVPRPIPRTNADVLAGGPFPVVLYSHGSSGIALAGFSYGEYLASWGFVVAAPDHTGNTTLNNSNPVALSYLVRPQDISATLDAIVATGAVAGRTSSDISAIGHSFGGYTVLSLLGAKVDNARIPTWGIGTGTCEQLDDGSCDVLAGAAASAKLAAGFGDPRFETVVAQTPVSMSFQDGQLAAIARPVMLITSRRDATLPWAAYAEPAWQRMDGADEVWVDLTKGGHYSVIAICEVVSPAILAAFGLDVASDGCGDDFTPISQIVPAVMAYTHAYIRLHSLGESQWRTVITGTPFHADVTVTTH